MALTITVTPDPFTYVVRLYVAGGVPPYTVTAAPDGGRPGYTVRSPQTTVTGDATARNMVDGQVPIGEAFTTYTATDTAGGSATASAVTVPAAYAVLSDTFDPNRLVTVTVLAQKPNHWQPRTVWFPVLGRRDPTVAVGPLMLRDGMLVLRPANVTRRAVIDLLSTGNPLMLRSPCPSNVDDVTLVVADLSERLSLDTAPAGPADFEMTYQAVTADLGPFTGDPSRSYASLPPAWPTYADLLPAYATYGDMTAGSAFANQGPQLVGNGWSTPADYATWTYGWSVGATGASVGGVGLITSSGTAGSRWIAEHTADIYNVATGPGRRYRVSFRARQASGAAGASAWVDALTNTAPATADYFVAGVVGSAMPPVALDGTWRTISYDATVPVGDDRLTVSFNVRNMPAGAATYEVSSPSVRELL